MTDATVARDHREEGAFATLRRGLRMMPEFRRGLPATFALALVATAGRVVVPIAVQQVIDRGLATGGDPDLGVVTRLVLLCAVVRRPRLLVLDDATSAVDPAVEARILDALRASDRPSTVVVIAYRQATISLADEVVWLEQGQVLARGSHEQLVDEVPGYAALVRAYSQAEVAA